jgi:hypothetical protein
LNSPAEPIALGCAAPGQPTLFAIGVDAPHEQDSAGWFEDVTRRTNVTNLAIRLIFLVLPAAALPIVIGAARRGKLDVRGAARITLIVGGALIAAALLRSPYFPTASHLIAFLSVQSIRAAGMALLLGLLYLAIDTQARRHWPHLLVAWNHLTTKGLRDPAVARHTLLGIVLGCVWGIFVAAERGMLVLLGWTERPAILEAAMAEKLMGTGATLAGILNLVPQAVMFGLIILVLLVAVRAVVRQDPLAAILCAILLAPIVVPRGAHPITSLLFLGVGVTAVAAWSAVRHGMLVIVVGVFVLSMLNTAPLTLQPQSWYFDRSVLVIGLIMILIVHGLLPRRGLTNLA